MRPSVLQVRGFVRTAAMAVSSLNDNTVDGTMPRDSDNVRRRFQEAALELDQNGGYDRTTVAEIAAKAGVTVRTFFRHFADKR